MHYSIMIQRSIERNKLHTKVAFGKCKQFNCIYLTIHSTYTDSTSIQNDCTLKTGGFILNVMRSHIVLLNYFQCCASPSTKIAIINV